MPPKISIFRSVTAQTGFFMKPYILGGISGHWLWDMPRIFWDTVLLCLPVLKSSIESPSAV